ncbi:MAG: hypothetical protein JWM12_842 [Ilumatobacteraceae bacterium]|nr:hypothetical protein [Ilumatobacteraceae bacterium]
MSRRRQVRNDANVGIEVSVRCESEIHMYQLRAAVARLTGRRVRVRPIGWWSYLGSFGDDFFSDE